MDPTEWLQTLGLERYAAAFRENEIDEPILPRLTAEDLKDIGVGAIGHRRKLLDAIAALRTDAKGEMPAEVASTPSGERRQVTVMFSDLVGSTALSTRMDPEDLREVISAYQKCVADTVQRFGGFVAKYMGDGVLVYFGYPQAHGDDAERAVRAGLEVVAAVSDLKTHATLQTRVGIATGLVVVGDLIGSGASQEQAIVGETPNLAGRLQSIAKPNSVIIAESTRKLVGNLFELQDVGAKDLKGIAEPVRAWEALRASSANGRFEALRAPSLTALVGREDELELLLRRWSKAKSGHGQVVLICGEAGIGKSRLIVALFERLAIQPHARLRHFCSPQHTDSALYPIIGQWERAARFAQDDTPQGRLDKLDAVLARTSASKENAALFADMLSLPNDGRYPTLELTPEQRRERTFQALNLHAFGLINQGYLWALTGSRSSGVSTLSSGIAAWRLTGANIWTPFFVSRLAHAYAELGDFQEASRCIEEAIEAVKTTKERWCEADICRIAGEIALTSPERDAVKAEEYFERALLVARQQQAKSWELRASVSLARLWRSQDQVQQAHELLAPVYGWFTEGFDTPDLREAKALLEELPS